MPCALRLNKNQKLLVFILVIFILSFSFFDILLAGLPFHYGEDTDMVRVALKTSWPELLTLAFNPFSPYVYRFGEETFLKTRPFETLIFKIVVSLYGFHAGPLYHIKSLCAGIMCAGLAFILFSATSSFFISLLAWLFFISAPSLFASVRYIHDYEIVSQCLLLSSLYLFGKLSWEKTSWGKMILWILGCLLFGIMALRTKETAKILPLAAMLFLIFRYQGKLWKIPTSREGLVQLFMVGFLFISIIFPFLANSSEPAGVLTWHPQNIYSFLIKNAFSYEPESRLALFTTENTMPGSFVGTLGFYLGWGVLLTFLAGLSSRRKFSLPSHFVPLFQLSLAWWIFSALGYALINRLDDRFLAVSLAPATICSFCGLHGALEQLKAGPRNFYRLLLFLIPLLCLVNFQRNLDHLIFSRNFHGGWLVAEGKIFRAVVQDRFPTEIATESRIDHFIEELPREILQNIRPPEGWDRRLNLPALNQLKGRFPYLYAASMEKDVFKNDPEWKLLGEITTLSDSLYGKIMARIKKKARKVLYLYKHGP